MQVILDSLFARPGSAPIRGGTKGEFRDWTIDIHELPLLAANTEMRLVPRLTNTGNPAMSPHAEGKKGRRVHVTLYMLQVQIIFRLFYF